MDGGSGTIRDPAGQGCRKWPWVTAYGSCCALTPCGPRVRRVSPPHHVGTPLASAAPGAELLALAQTHVHTLPSRWPSTPCAHAIPRAGPRRAPLSLLHCVMDTSATAQTPASLTRTPSPYTGSADAADSAVDDTQAIRGHAATGSRRPSAAV